MHILRACFVGYDFIMIWKAVSFIVIYNISLQLKPPLSDIYPPGLKISETIKISGSGFIITHIIESPDTIDLINYYIYKVSQFCSQCSIPAVLY